MLVRVFIMLFLLAGCGVSRDSDGTVTPDTTTTVEYLTDAEWCTCIQDRAVECQETSTDLIGCIFKIGTCGPSSVSYSCPETATDADDALDRCMRGDLGLPQPSVSESCL